MKFALIHLGLLLCLLPAAAQVPLSRLERVWMFGAEYVRLDDWARINGGQCRWIVPKQQAKAVVPAGTLIVDVDSRKASIKGVNVWLSAPVVFRGASAYVASSDFANTIHPLLFPTKQTSARPIKTIVLDPGHGGKDPGNKEGSRLEKTYTLQLAKDLRDVLSKAGFQIYFTRRFDSTVELDQRPVLARQRGADLFISLHFNSADGAGGSSAKGAEVFCLTPANTHSTNDREGRGASATVPGNRHDTRNVQLAYQVQRALVTKSNSEDRGVKRARFAVLRGAEMPAVLIEAAFMTNASDAKKIYDTTQRRALAQSIADGIMAYKRQVER